MGSHIFCGGFALGWRWFGVGLALVCCGLNRLTWLTLMPLALLVLLALLMLLLFLLVLLLMLLGRPNSAPLIPQRQVFLKNRENQSRTSRCLLRQSRQPLIVWPAWVHRTGGSLLGVDQRVFAGHLSETRNPDSDRHRLAWLSFPT